MAGILSTAAGEITRLAYSIWGGIGIAMKLNYEVMSNVLKVTTRIVHLLLLLTQKVYDLILILCEESLNFLSDIGVWVLNFCQGFCSLAFALADGIQKTGDYGRELCNLVISIIAKVHQTCLLICDGFVFHLGNLLVLLKNTFILFGSSIMFSIQFIPNLIILIINYIRKFLSTAQLSALSLHLYVIGQLKKSARVVTSGINAVFDIPLHAYMGVLVGVIMIYLIRLGFIHQLITIPSPLTTFSNLRRKIIGTYTRIVHRIHAPVVHHNDTEEEDLVQDSDSTDNSSSESSSSDNSSSSSVIAAITTRPPLTRHRARTLGLSGQVTDQDVLASGQSPSKSSPEKSAQELKLLLDRERDTRLCIVCQDKPKTVILLPCRHLCLCYTCRLILIRANQNCPICRRPITDSLKVYT